MVVEIGPGRGALTAHLLETGLTVRAVEIDSDLAGGLTERFGPTGRFELIAGDARTFDYSRLGASFKVAGNLPYNVAGPITARLLEFSDRIPVMVLMYQREVARRITAAPGNRDYGYLTCLVGYHAEAEYLETIPPGAFWPPPKIHSGVVRLRPRPGRSLPPGEEKALFDVVRGAFAHRRKTLLNALAAAGFSARSRESLAEVLRGSGIEPGRRPETLSLEEFARAARAIAASAPAAEPAGEAP
jgi:16S rRNA (adenine1518-N6/adenine1519-N6)-dimethyltransferase